MSDTGTCEVVVAGGGIAGLTAGLTAARLGRNTLVLTGPVPGGHLLSIEKIDGYPGFPDGIPGYELCPRVQEQAADAGADFAASELKSLRPDEGRYRLHSTNEEYLASTVILATGSELRKLGIPGEERFRGKGVSHCASCDAMLHRDRVVAVVGGGDSALQESLTLAEHASRVVIIHRGSALSGQAAYRRRVEAHPGIDIRFNTVVDEILGDEAVSGVRLRDVETTEAAELEVAGVFIYVGMQANTGFLEDQSMLDAEQRIPVDDRMRSALKGVFAAGIVRSGTPGRAASSAGDGAVAAIAADRYLRDGVWSGPDRKDPT